MAKSTKDTRLTVTQVHTFIENFDKQARRVYNNEYAYTSGYLMSMLSGIISQMPLKEQMVYINQLQTASIWSEKPNARA